MGVSAQPGAVQQALAVLADAQPLVRMATSRQAVSEVPMAMAQVPARALGVALVSGLPAQFVVPPVLALAEPVPVPVAGEEARADAPV